jgi:hypothetical protein
MAQTERRANNEALFRQVNEQIVALGSTRERVEIVCECSLIDCTTPVEVRADDYEEARRDPVIFIVAPRHYDPEIELVAADFGEYMFVRKVGEAGEVARATDPRSG